MKPLLVLPRKLTALSALVLALPALAQSVATSKPLIAFQSLVTDQHTNVIAAGKFAITFQIYDQPVGGTLLWSERHQAVDVQQGMLNVILGSGADLSKVDFAPQRYLGIILDVDGNPNTPDPEMPGRPALLPAFWAKNSDKLAGYDWTAMFPSNSPSGTLLPAKIGAGSIATAQLAANAVTAEKLAAASVNANHLQVGAIGPNQIQTGAVGQRHREAAPMAVSPSLGGFAENTVAFGITSTNSAPVFLKTTGMRPVWIGLVPSSKVGPAEPSNGLMTAKLTNSKTPAQIPVATFTATFRVDGIAKSKFIFTVRFSATANDLVPPATISTILPPIEPLPGGASHQIDIVITPGNADAYLESENVRLVAYEM